MNSLSRNYYNNKKSKENIFSSVKNIIYYIYFENITEILIEEKNKFINKIESKILEILKYQFKENESQHQKELLIYQKIKELITERYESDFLLLNSEYKKYKKYPYKVTYLKKYRKHCINSEQYPTHKCSSNKLGKFIEVFQNNNHLKNVLNLTNNKENNSYIICSECKTCYLNSFIKIYCPSCRCDYYSSKLNEDENENILPATWKEYHCQPIIVNEMMKCIKCEHILYINLFSKKLVCLNKKCNFNSSPNSIIWKCKICKKDFRSSAKIFNPLESKILQNEVWKCLVYKNLALPKKLFCCSENEKHKNIKYFHDKKCKGELYIWKYNDNDIIVCGLCHAINFYEKFIWTCPICNLRFNYHGKKQRNENSINKNIILRSNSKLENKNDKSFYNYNSENKPNTEKTIKENENLKISSNKRPGHKHNFSTNIKIFITDDDKENNKYAVDEKLIYENNLSIQSIEAINNNTIDLNKNNYILKNDDENCKNNNILKNYNAIPRPKYSIKKKKVRYQTLFDILEEREKYKINNQSRDENINNENFINAKIKLDEYYNKKRLKLLEQSKPKTSLKKEKKTLFQKYFVKKNEKKNILINNLINKNIISKSKEIGNNIINISDTEEKINEDENMYEYNTIKKNLQKKLSGDLNKFSSNIIGVPPEVKNSELRISDFKDKLYSKRYKDDQSIITNEVIEKNNKSKKKDINKNQRFRYKLYKLNIDKKKCYIQESNNTYKDYFSRNISAKKSSENIKRNLSMNNEKKKIYLKKCNEIDNINENINNVDEFENEIYINDENDINLDKEKIKEHELKNKNDILNSSKMRKNQIFKRIFLNKIKKNSRNICSCKKQDSLNENHSQIGILNNNFEMKISPLGDAGEGIVVKD